MIVLGNKLALRTQKASDDTAAVLVIHRSPGSRSILVEGHEQALKKAPKREQYQSAA